MWNVVWQYAQHTTLFDKLISLMPGVIDGVTRAL